MDVTKEDIKEIFENKLKKGYLFDEWWERPHMFFRGRTPKQLVERGRGQELIDFIKEYSK